MATAEERVALNLNAQRVYAYTLERYWKFQYRFIVED